MFDERFVDVGGTRLFCRVEGQHDGPVVLLHHSLATDLRSWDRIVPALGADYKVVRFDARGHGKSGVPAGPYDLPSLAEDVVRLMDRLEINRAHFAGLSMGGMIGQVLGLEHADRLRSLVLASTTSAVGRAHGTGAGQGHERGGGRDDWPLVYGGFCRRR